MIPRIQWRYCRPNTVGLNMKIQVADFFLKWPQMSLAHHDFSRSAKCELDDAELHPL